LRSGIAAIAVVLATIASIVLPPPLLLVWNTTASTPVGLYAVSRSVPKRGDLFVTRLPREMEALAVSRRILSAKTPVLKPIAAVAGDLVCRTGPAIRINGRFAAIARGRDGHGRPLPTWRGCRRLSSSQVFVLARDAHSFDSRYYGPLDIQLARGIARPLLAF
jgi:conjugative transfer signal peptidase TraF